MTSLAAPCYHCGLPAHPEFSAPLQGALQHFCCLGCQAVAQAIMGSGLGDFYQFREQQNPKVEAQALAFSAYDNPAVQSEFVHSLSGDLHEAQLLIGGISCAACVWLIEKHLQTLPGLVSVSVNSTNHRAFVRWHSEQLPLSRIFAALGQIGFTPMPQVAASAYQFWQAQQKTALLRVGVAGISMMQAGMVAVGLYAGALQGLDAHWQNILRWITCIFALPVLFYAAVPFYVGAWRALRLRQLTMDVSVSLALLLAFAASLYATLTRTGEVYFESLSMFVFILLSGRYLEQRARFRNFQQSASLQSLLPLAVTQQLADGSESLVPLRSVEPGQRIRVMPGAIFPCDGRVLAGSSYAIEAILSGEAEPQAKQPGDRVLAGTHNGDTALLLEVEATGAATQLAAIEQLFAQAASQRPAQQALADRLAGHFVAAVLVISLATFAVWYWLEPSRALWIALSVLVVTCPCALSLATPAALVCGLGRLRQQGLLVTSPSVLETLTRVTHVVFDKTGTLTHGELRVEEVTCLRNVPRDAVLAIIAALEAASAHPIAKAFALYASDLRASNLEVVAASGVQGEVMAEHYRFGTPAFAWPASPPAYPNAGQWQLLADAQGPIAWVRLCDQLRLSALPALAQLRAQGLAVSLLSGDRAETVTNLAADLGIDDAQGAMVPAAKLAQVQSLQQQGSVVLMVGDGINDVPVLGGADVSIAMGSASALTQTRADAILLSGDLQALPKALVFAQRVTSVIRQNLWWALAYNLVALPAAVMGWIPPWLAAVGMSSSSLVVVLNSLRLNPSR